MNHIGLDFDNTIVLYDEIFYDYALKLGKIDKEIPHTKEAVRNYLIHSGNEDIFTKIQGKIYGELIKEAPVQEGLIEAIYRLKSNGYQFSIVSHKTKYPIIGERVDLHQSALRWLIKNGFTEGENPLIKIENIFFEETFTQKIERINSIKCDIYVDDLPKVLDELGEDIIKVYFSKHKDDPNKIKDQSFYKLFDWNDFENLIVDKVKIK